MRRIGRRRARSRPFFAVPPPAVHSQDVAAARTQPGRPAAASRAKGQVQDAGAKRCCKRPRGPGALQSERLADNEYGRAWASSCPMRAAGSYKALFAIGCWREANRQSSQENFSCPFGVLLCPPGRNGELWRSGRRAVEIQLAGLGAIPGLHYDKVSANSLQSDGRFIFLWRRRSGALPTSRLFVLLL